MDKVERAAYLLQRLGELFPDPQIPLAHRDNFTLLIAVLLSAQCTDERVNQVTPALFERAATPQAMAALDVEEIEQLIRPCGLAPQKSKAIKGLSQLLLAKHQGVVPLDFDLLIELPGVGRKTAQVLMSAQGIAAFPVDTHIERLARAWKLTAEKRVELIERDLKQLFPPNTWGNLHLQIIFFGRTFCPKRKCNGEQCFLCQELNQ